MTFAVTISWWMIPTLITIVVFIIAAVISSRETGFLAGIGAMMFLVPGLAVALISWIVAGVLK